MQMLQDLCERLNLSILSTMDHASPALHGFFPFNLLHPEAENQESKFTLQGFLEDIIFFISSPNEVFDFKD